MKARLTPHQEEVMSRVRRFYARRKAAVPVEAIGSRQALRHLAAKGYITLTEGPRGPRGGERWFAEPVESERI